MFFRLFIVASVMTVITGFGYLFYVYGIPVLESFMQASDESDYGQQMPGDLLEDKYGDPLEWVDSGVYPFNKTLTDSQGREGNFVIKGRSSDRLYVQRMDTEIDHTIYINTLSSKDRAFAEGLPNRSANQTVYIENKKIEAQKIIDDIWELRREEGSGVKTTAQIRSIRKEIELLERRLLTVRSQMIRGN